MRILKYRAWIKDKHKMEKVSSITFLTNNSYTISTDNLDLYDFYSYAEYVLMEFTGIKDKTGKEVYEGDIVRFYDDYDEEYITTVVFIDCLGAYGVEWDGFQSSFDDINEYYSKDIEVIGNIYEDPELLEK